MLKYLIPLTVTANLAMAEPPNYEKLEQDSPSTCDITSGMVLEDLDQKVRSFYYRAHVVGCELLNHDRDQPNFLKQQVEMLQIEMNNFFDKNGIQTKSVGVDGIIGPDTTEAFVAYALLNNSLSFFLEEGSVNRSIYFDRLIEEFELHDPEIIAEMREAAQQQKENMLNVSPDEFESIEPNNVPSVPLCVDVQQMLKGRVECFREAQWDAPAPTTATYTLDI